MTGPEESAGEDLADHDSLYSATAPSSQNILTPTTTPAPSRTGSMHHNNGTGARTSGYVDAADTQSQDYPVLSSAGRYERLRDQEARLVTDAARLAKMTSTFARNKLQQWAELDEHMAELQARKAEISALTDDEDVQGMSPAPTSRASNVHEIEPQVNDHPQSLPANTGQHLQLTAAFQEISSLQAHVQALETGTKEQAGTVTALATAITSLQSDIVQFQQALTDSREESTNRTEKVEARSTEQDATNSRLATRIMPLERAHLGSSLACYVRLQSEMSNIRAMAQVCPRGPFCNSSLARAVYDVYLLLADRALYSSECRAFREELCLGWCGSFEEREEGQRDNTPALEAVIDKYEPHVSEMMRAALAAWDAANEH
ncbi:hypothetical protein LTS10_005067 [Elasticomyces elasticus]|nr:hypothetical protein LTS10_005067 [Elasticomyces elasticus]